jgi:hypothetical protein
MPKREKTLQAFLDNAALLIQACPTTVFISLFAMLIQTRLTLKYKVPKQPEGTTNAISSAILVAKAYDPVGGVCLKYQTNRAVEVGRLMVGFQELGQWMQNVPPTAKQKPSSEEEMKAEPMVIDEPEKVAQEKQGTVAKPETSTSSALSQPGGGKKRKKAKR